MLSACAPAPCPPSTPAPPPEPTPTTSPAAPRATERSTPTTIVLVRHAEKASEGDDPPLTDAGHARAEALAHALSDAEVAAIYVSDWTRTRQTASPLADDLGLPLLPYDPDRSEEEVLRILGAHPGQTVLVVGHKPSVPRMINRLLEIERMTELDRYDDLFVVVVAPSGPVVTRLRYGAR